MSGNNLLRIKLIRDSLFPDRYLFHHIDFNCYLFSVALVVSGLPVCVCFSGSRNIYKKGSALKKEFFLRGAILFFLKFVPYGEELEAKWKGQLSPPQVYHIYEQEKFRAQLS